MEWLQAKTLEELKTCGSFNKVRQKIKGHLGDKLLLKARGWNDLFSVVQTIQGLLSHKEASLSHEAPRIEEQTSLYFKSEAAQIIYALLRLDGDLRLKELGVDKSHIRDPEKAKKWRNNIAKVIHPDLCKHPEAATASAQLSKLYEKMIG